MTEAERKLLVEELIAHSEFKAAGAIENDGRRISVLLETIETQARENERLREALGLADAALRGANMNMNVVERKLRAALEARHD